MRTCSFLAHRDRAWDFGIPDQVMANVEVEIAVAVEIGEGRRGGPVAVAPQSGAIGRVFEGTIAPVAIESVASPSRDEEVGLAVVVVVPDRRHRSRSRLPSGQSGRPGHVLEGSIAPIAKEPVIERTRPAAGGKLPPWTR